MVYDLGDEGTKSMNVGFNQGCGKRIQGAGDGFHLNDDALNLILRDFREAAEMLGNLRQLVDSRDGVGGFFKKDMKALHCFSVFLVCEEVCGLKRLFTLEKSCLEFLGILLMILV